MSEFIAIVRDDALAGVRVDRVDGWDVAPSGKTRVWLTGGGFVDLRIPMSEFAERLDGALTAMQEER